MKPRGSCFVVRLFERNARALCKPRCVYLFKLEINILIGRSCPKQTEHHWLSSRFKTKCLNTALGSGLIYLPQHRDGADGGRDKWRSKGGTMFGVGDGCCLIFCLVTVLTCKWRLRKTTKEKEGRQSERETRKISYIQVDKTNINQVFTKLCL